MSPERPVRVVGRCTECREMIVEVVDVSVSGIGVSVGARIVRRCGCGDFVPADSQNATPHAERET